MSVEIVMPKLSDTMEEGTILKWLRKEGDAVRRGEVIAEVETDKADMELEATASGVLEEIKVAEGESATVGTVLALVGEVREAADGAAARGERAGGAAAKPSAVPRDAAAAASADGPRPIKSSPSARQLAEEHAIDLGRVRGSGPGGRIVKEDVEAAVAARASAEPAARSDEATARRPGARSGSGPEGQGEPERAPNAGGPAFDADDRPSGGRARPAAESGPRVAERHELSRMRQSIARRMTEAFRDVPHFAVTTEIDMTEAVRLREALKTGGLVAVPVTYTHLVLRATALALRRHPRLNASYRDGAMEVHAAINLGMAVAVEDGLIVPILKGADELSLEEIAVEARRLAEQAAQGRFVSADLSGGTFTVSNLGMFDVEDFTAVINPPQAGILAVGAIKERPIVRDGQVVAARTMRVTLSCDHRIVDGVAGSRFLMELKGLLERPLALVMRGTS